MLEYLKLIVPMAKTLALHAICYVQPIFWVDRMTDAVGNERSGKIAFVEVRDVEPMAS